MNSPQSALSSPAPVGVASREYWLCLLALVIAGGSAFAAIRIGVETAPASVVAAGRLWIATFVLYVYMRMIGRRLPPLKGENGGLSPVWSYAMAIGIIGYAGPMFLFPFAQQSISSLLAGIYMAFMPIVTVFLASTFADEKLTARKLIGFSFGTVGVIVLIGPAALRDIFSQSVIAQGALILATTGYAIATVVMRRAPETPARPFAVAMMLIASLATTPFAIYDLVQSGGPSVSSTLAIIYLGVIPTGATALVIIHLIRGPGAGFMAMGNYLTPLVAIVFGVLIFGEPLEARYIWGLLVILAGLAIAQPGPARALLGQVKRLVTARGSDRADTSRRSPPE